RKNISSSSIEYHDYNTGAKLDKDKIPSSTEVLYQDPQAGTSVDGTVILYVSVATASSNLQSSSSSTTHSSSTSSSTDSTTSSTETSTEATHTELQ
ncbi:MAG: serine/threonine protein kinase, partial [Streptococcus salivarius]